MSLGEGGIIDLKRFMPGDIAFIISNNKYVSEVTIVKVAGGFATVRFMGSDGGMRVRESRLFSSKEEAEKI